MKKLLLPFLIPVVGFAAVKGYYWYQVKSAVDQFSQQLNAFAAVEYDGILAGFDGVAGVTGLRITPFGSTSPLQADALSIKAPSWTYFLKAKDQGDLPHALEVRLSGFSVDMNDDLFQQALFDAPGEALLGCPNAPSGVELMKVLGYQNLITDLEMGYRFNPQSEFMTLQVKSSVADDFDFLVRADIDLGTSDLTRSVLSGEGVRLGGLELVYRDRSFNERRNRYCAGLNSEEVSTFVNRHVALLADHYRAMGFAFSEALEVAYRDFVAGDGELKLSFHAEEPLGTAALAVYSPADLLGAMELSVAINGDAVEPLALSWAPPTVSTEVGVVAGPDPQTEAVPVEITEAVQAQPLDSQASIEEVSAPEAQDAEPSRTERFEATAFQKPDSPEVQQPETYHSVALAALENHEGRPLRIRTHNGRQIEGTLLSLSRSRLNLRQQIGRGEAILPITFARIASIEAYY